MHSFIIIQSSRVQIVPHWPEMLGIQNSVSSCAQWPCLVVTTEREEVSPASRGEAAGPGLEINRAVDTVATGQVAGDTIQSGHTAVISILPPVSTGVGNEPS